MQFVQAPSPCQDQDRALSGDEISISSEPSDHCFGEITLYRLLTGECHVPTWGKGGTTNYTVRKPGLVLDNKPDCKWGQQVRKIVLEERGGLAPITVFWVKKKRRALEKSARWSEELAVSSIVFSFCSINFRLLRLQLIQVRIHSIGFLGFLFSVIRVLIRHRVFTLFRCVQFHEDVLFFWDLIDFVYLFHLFRSSLL